MTLYVMHVHAYRGIERTVNRVMKLLLSCVMTGPTLGTTLTADAPRGSANLTSRLHPPE